MRSTTCIAIAALFCAASAMSAQLPGAAAKAAAQKAAAATNEHIAAEQNTEQQPKTAAKTAVQLIFPLVLFIFPGIFVVLVGPAAINIANQLLPKMK